MVDFLVFKVWWVLICLVCLLILNSVRLKIFRVVINIKIVISIISMCIINVFLVMYDFLLLFKLWMWEIMCLL